MKHSKVIPSFFIVGVRDFSYSAELESFLKTFPVSGLALFNSPFDNPLNIWNNREAALEGIHEFVVKAGPKVNFLAVDQEGGRVRRLRSPFVHLPSALQIREAFENTRDLNEIENLYRLAARQMALTGIHLNFAPVCDLSTKDSNKVVGDRSYGETVGQVLPFVERFCKAFESEGVFTTLKHFPGHGPTTFDSHEQIAVVFKSREELFKVDRDIFLKAAKYSSAILTAHIAFEDEPDRIFSLDQKLLNHFKEGLPKNLALITDDLLSMKSVADKSPWLKALDCEYDFILLCGSLESSAAAIEETIRYAESKQLSFSQELALEKRAQRSASFFIKKTEVNRLAKWRENILSLEQEGNDSLEKLKIKF